MRWPFLVLVLLIGLSSEAPQSFVFQFYQLGYSMENEDQVRKLRFLHSKEAWPDPVAVTLQGLVKGRLISKCPLVTANQQKNQRNICKDFCPR